MDVNEPETGGSADSLRSGLRIAIFSGVDCKAWLAAERGRREVPRGKVISWSFLQGWVANLGCKLRSVSVRSPCSFSDSLFSLCAVLLPTQTLIWCLSVKYPPWKVIFVTINLMDARDTTAFCIKLNCFHFSTAISLPPKHTPSSPWLV